jgi:hypothetical protein
MLGGDRDVFSEEGLAQLRGFPEVGRGDLIRYFTLTAAEQTFVRKSRGQGNVLGAAVQLCTLPWLGFVPDEVASAPAAAVARLSTRLGVPAGELRGYGAGDGHSAGHCQQHGVTRSATVINRQRRCKCNHAGHAGAELNPGTLGYEHCDVRLAGLWGSCASR